MHKAIVTESGGLIGSESTERLVESGYDVIGIETDTRAVMFGPEVSTSYVTDQHAANLDSFQSVDLDIRDTDGVDRVFSEQGKKIDLVIHAAVQPSHDWTAGDPQADFTINANGTLNMLEATHNHCPDATFIFTSTNKVYGDTPNRLPLIDTPTADGSLDAISKRSSGRSMKRTPSDG